MRLTRASLPAATTEARLAVDKPAACDLARQEKATVATSW